MQPLAHDDEFAALRGRFPSLAARTCMTAHSFGPCPAEMFDDLEAYRESLTRRPRHLQAWFERLHEMYGLLERLLGAPAGSIALRESTTGCHATILAALEPGTPRRRILGSALQFPSVGYVLAAQARRGFAVEMLPAGVDGRLDADAIARHIDGATACVAVPVVAPVTGALLDMRAVADAAWQAGAIPIFDATAAVGLVPIDVSELPPCVVIGGTVKWLGGGGTGLAFMYVHPALLERLPVAYPGWLGDARFTELAPEFVPADGARRDQQGTPAMEPVYTARAGIHFALATGAPLLFARNRALLDRISARAHERGLAIRSPSIATWRAGVIAVEVRCARGIVDALAREHIDVDARGEHTVRLGPHGCVSFAECESAVDRLAEIAASIPSSS